MAKSYNVTVSRVNESAHQSAEVSIRALSVSVREDGGLSVQTEEGAQFFGATTWGSVTIVRVPGR